MPTLLTRLSLTDEELGKRDDNYRPSTASHTRYPALLAAAAVPPWRRKIILGLLAAVALVYLFINYIPTELGSIDERMGRPLRPSYRLPDAIKALNKPGPQKDSGVPRPVSDAILKVSKHAPPRPKQDSTSEESDDQIEHYYSGTIRYLKLASTLTHISETMGKNDKNRNVLFAASSLASAASLIPLACGMAQLENSFVHFLLAGRASLPLDDLLEANNVPDCTALFHDGRADFSLWSTDDRAERSVIGAMRHVTTYMHPQVIITDDLQVEDAFFAQAIRVAAQRTTRPIIEIPDGKYSDLYWITRLDSGSLAAWHQPQIDILIHVEPGTAGGMIRLLRSLEIADYTGLRTPRLTIELPPDVDPFITTFLQDFAWPPLPDTETAGMSRAPNDLRIHHRIIASPMSPEESSVRFFESFYPSDPDDSHILVLSAQAEVSPLFYQYLMYTLLQTRYSTDGSPLLKSLFGIGLLTPTTLLSDAAPLNVPSIESLNSNSSNAKARHFMWQAPSADGLLISGRRWIEAHNYLSNRLRAFHAGASSSSTVRQQPKQVSRSQPAWMEYLLELFRARGYTTMFPIADANIGSWAILHEELARVPEEHRQLKRPQRISHQVDADVAPQKLNRHEPFLSGGEVPPRRRRRTAESRRPNSGSTPLHILLPYPEEEDVIKLPTIPVLDSEGEVSSHRDLRKAALDYRVQLRERVGGCSAQEASEDQHSRQQDGLANDLFCTPTST